MKKRHWISLAVLVFLGVCVASGDKWRLRYLYRLYMNNTISKFLETNRFHIGVDQKDLSPPLSMEVYIPSDQ